jgi:hypothetical protein
VNPVIKFRFSIKGGEFLDQLGLYEVLKKNTAPRMQSLAWLRISGELILYLD